MRAMVSGVPPALLAETEMTGTLTSGRSETGSDGRARRPDSTAATRSSVVATGRRTKKAMKVKGNAPSPPEGSVYKTIDAGGFSPAGRKNIPEFSEPPRRRPMTAQR
ncbi:hypothetical protein EDC31_102316 [Acidomonas methanolica]|nr:hypothetical protein EDC31_102316 [Acidomonas methanolica]